MISSSFPIGKQQGATPSETDTNLGQERTTSTPGSEPSIPQELEDRILVESRRRYVVLGCETTGSYWDDFFDAWAVARLFDRGGCGNPDCIRNHRILDLREEKRR